ncbi:MAG: sigma 54-interacting transcriptional regulator [Puniceicoccales bacterium]|nr:sigma 54-interacting transcriptional regulator [Puniceicoccales bacterium]
MKPPNIPNGEIDETSQLSQIACDSEELKLFDESLIYSEDAPQNLEIHTPESLFPEEVLRRAGVYDNSLTLSTFIKRLTALAQNRMPVLFVGPPGSGKWTFAALLHQLTSCGTASHCAIDCREPGAFPPSHRELEALVHSLKAELRPTLTVLHPEVLHKKLRNNLFDAIVSSDGTVRFQVVLDQSAMASFLRAAPSTVRSVLRAQVAQVPDLCARREDLKFHVLAKLGELNGRFGVRKQIGAAALNRLISYEFADNFRGLFRTVEWLHSTQVGVINFDESMVQDRFTFPGEGSTPSPLGAGFCLESHIKLVRKKLLREALRRSRNNFSRAARMLGVSPQAVSKSAKNLVAQSTGRTGSKC